MTGRAHNVELAGATERDYQLAFGAKLVHLFMVLCVPLLLHGSAAWVPYLAFGSVGSVVLAWLFAVSHNLEDTKKNFKDGASLRTPGRRGAKRPGLTRDIVWNKRAAVSRGLGS